MIKHVQIRLLVVEYTSVKSKVSEFFAKCIMLTVMEKARFNLSYSIAKEHMNP